MTSSVRTLAKCVLATALLSLSSAPLLAAEGPGQTYKWVDDQGVTHYGDTVPAEYAQKERSVLNSRGVEINRVEGRKTAEQQQAANAAEQKETDRRQHDQFLLRTYTSTRDIERLRDERLDQLDGQVKATALYIGTLDSRLLSLQDRVQVYKPYSTKPDARRLPDDLAEELVRTASERNTQSQALDKRKSEEADVRSQFNGDIVRYKELISHAAN
jgi:Domain of unknown function (DUF4124)